MVVWKDTPFHNYYHLFRSVHGVYQGACGGESTTLMSCVSYGGKLVFRLIAMYRYDFIRLHVCANMSTVFVFLVPSKTLLSFLSLSLSPLKSLLNIALAILFV